jgi:hypothetical protein
VVYPLNCIFGLLLSYILIQINGLSVHDEMLGLLPLELTTNAIALVISAVLFIVIHFAGQSGKMEKPWILLVIFLACLEGASMISFKQSIIFLMLPNFMSGIFNGSMEVGLVPLAILLSIPLAYMSAIWFIRK